MWVDGQHGSGRTGNQHELRMLMKRTAVTATLPLLIIWWRVWRLRSVIHSPLFRRRPGRDGGWRMEGGDASPSSCSSSNLCSVIANAVPLTRRSATKCQGVCSG